MLDTALFILEGVLLNEKARPTWGVYMSKGEGGETREHWSFSSC